MSSKVPSFRAYQACIIHMRAERHLTIVVQKVLEEYSLTKGEWLALSLIMESGESGRTNSQLSGELGVGLPHITALLKTLVRIELVTQQHSPDDRRANTTVITDKGLKVLTDAESKIYKRLKKWLDTIPAQKRRDYLDTVAFLSRQHPDDVI